MSDLDADFCRWRYWWTRNRNKFTTTRQASVAAWTAAVESCGAAQEARPLSDEQIDGWTQTIASYSCCQWHLVGNVQIRRFARAIHAASQPAAPAKKACKYGDKFCPCPDGDLCHYEGKGAWPQPAQAQEAPAENVGDTRFGGWLGCHDPDRTEGIRPAFTKQDMRDSYWAGYCERRAAQEAPALSDVVAQAAYRLHHNVAGRSENGIANDMATVVGYVRALTATDIDNEGRTPVFALPAQAGVDVLTARRGLEAIKTRLISIEAERFLTTEVAQELRQCVLIAEAHGADIAPPSKQAPEGGPACP